MTTKIEKPPQTKTSRKELYKTAREQWPPDPDNSDDPLHNVMAYFYQAMETVEMESYLQGLKDARDRAEKAVNEALSDSGCWYSNKERVMIAVSEALDQLIRDNEK